MIAERIVQLGGVAEGTACVAASRSQLEEYPLMMGRWIEDPQTVQRPANPHGGFNSVLLVPLAVRTDIL